MFDSKLIEVVISLTFFFLLLSFICSAALELIEMYVKRRAAFLRRGIYELAGPNSADFVRTLYRHPLIKSLYKGTYDESATGFLKTQNLPSYIPAQNFALALIDLKNRGANLPPSIKDALHTFEVIAGQDVELLLQFIEHGHHRRWTGSRAGISAAPWGSCGGAGCSTPTSSMLPSALCLSFCC